MKASNPSASRLSILFALAFPIIAGMTSQNIFNLVDTYMVGYLGAEALAAVGLSNNLNFMCIAFITGLSAGVQAMTAWRKGGGDMDTAAVPLNGGILLCLVLGVPLSVMVFFATPGMFQILTPDPEVIDHAVPYFEARAFGMVALGLNFAYRGFWNGISMAKVYMHTLIVMNIANIILNYVLIFGHWGVPALGTQGAGIGTTLSAWIGVAFYAVQARARVSDCGYLKVRPARAEISKLLSLSLPVSIQQLFFAMGLTVYFWIIGRVGSEELAISNVMLNISLVMILPCLGLGMASASLVGQRLGAGEPDNARHWGWYTSRASVVMATSLALPVALWPEPLLAMFLHDPHLVTQGVLPLRIMLASLILDAVANVLNNSLNGAGRTRLTSLVGISTQWGINLPVAYAAVVYWGGGLVAIWVIFGLYRAIVSILYALVWWRIPLHVPERAAHRQKDDTQTA